MNWSRTSVDRLIVACVGIACLAAPAVGVSYCKKGVPGSACARYFALFDTDPCCPDVVITTSECQSLATPMATEEGRFDSSTYQSTCKFKRNTWNVPGADPCKPGVTPVCILDETELSGQVDCEKPSGNRVCFGDTSTP